MEISVVKKIFIGLLFGTFAAQANETKLKPTAHYDREADPHHFTIFMEDGGWCWFQDPRAVLHDDQVIIGSVKGNGSGAALIGSYDLKTNKSLGNFIAKDHFDRDDHNSPAFYLRPDGSMLAVYARHGREKVHYYRISNSSDYTKWGVEQIYDHSDFLKEVKDRVTYMNLFHMSSEGKLYNFYRGLQFNPSFITSTDQGKSWGEDTHFIQSEIKGRHRPYTRYAGNGVDTIHVSFTDAHPHLYGNHIYYAAFRNGKFYRADGSFIKSLSEGPLRPSEAELVYKGGGKADKNNAAWTSTMVYDENGFPHIGYTVHKANTDHRFRIASWNGKRWIDREVAYAGKCLYKIQRSYTGLITLDPVDPSYVVISTDVDPSTGTNLDGKHEIYRARISQMNEIQSIHWEPITHDSSVCNIRPIILRDKNKRIVLWNRGDYQSYVDYDLDTVGVVEKID